MGYALSHSRKQRIHIESSMFSSAMVDFTVVITDSMVSELAEAGGLLDSAGPALSDGHDIRIAADANGDVALPIDLRGFSQAADPANGGIEFATKIPLTDPVAGNDIYLFYGDDDAPAVLPTDPLGQYEAYDDDTIFYAPVGGGANRTAFNITGTDVGGITAGDIAAPSGLLGTQHTDVGDYSTYGDNPDLDLVNTDWTVSFLFRATTSGLEQYILGKYNHTTQDRGYLCIFSGSQHFDLTYQPVRTSYNPIYRLSSGVDVVDGQWHHLAGTFISGTRASVYTEGILRNTTTNNIPFSVASNNASFQIGTQITAQNEPADFSQVKVHSVARSADWIASTHNNFMNGDTLFTGYNYTPALGAVIPYSGNEAAYEAFNSVGGGYFQGDGNAFFRLGQEYLIDVTQPFEIEFKAFYNASYIEGFNGLFSPKAGSPGRIIIQNSNRRIYPHGANLPSAVYLGSLIDDANWHTYKIVGDGVNVSFVRDGSTERSVGIASYDGGFKYDSLLVNTNEEHPWEHNIAYLSVTKNGVLTHYWDFGLTNAAGDAGPDRVLDLVGGVYGVGVNIVNANWKRTADLPNNLPNGFNLYSLEPNFPVPASLNVPGFDPFGVAIQYSNPIPSGGVVDYDTLVSISKALLGTKPYDTAIAISKALAFLRDYDAHVDISKAIQGTKPYDTKVEIFSAGVSVKQYDTSITINKLLAFMLSYDTRVTISKAYYNQKDYDTIVTITKVIDQVRGYDTEVSISKTLQSNKDYDTIVRAIRDSKVPLEVIHKANLRMADRILYRNLRIASKDEYKRLRIH
jgi:hypothetical protein